MELSPRVGYGETGVGKTELQDVVSSVTPRIVGFTEKVSDTPIVPKSPPAVPFGRWNPDQWKPSDGVGPSTFLGSYQRTRVEGRRGRTYWEWKAAEMQRAVSGDEGDDEMTSLESGTLEARYLADMNAGLKVNGDNKTTDTAHVKQDPTQTQCVALQYNNNNQYKGVQEHQREKMFRQDSDAACRVGQGALVQNEGSLYYTPGSQDSGVPVVGGVRVLPPYATQQYAPYTANVEQPIVIDQCQIIAQYQSSVKESPIGGRRVGNSPIAKVKVTSFVQPKLCAPSSSVAPAPSAPTKEQIYNEPDESQIRSPPVGDETQYKLKEVPAWTRQDSSSPSLSGILKKPPPRPKQDEVKVHGSPKLKFKKQVSTDSGKNSQCIDIREKFPIPGKSSTSSSANNSPIAIISKTDIITEPLFSQGPDSRPNLFCGPNKVSLNSKSNFPVRSQHISFSPIFSKGGSSQVCSSGAPQSIVSRTRGSGAPIRRGAERDSGALVWVTQPGGGAKLDWVPTPNLSTLRSQSHTPGARVTRQRSDAGRETRPPDRGGGRHSVERMQSPGVSAVAFSPATTCSPPILKTSQSYHESKNAHRSAPGNARPESRSKPGEDDDCVVAVPGRTSGQIVRIRVRPEVHAYLAGLPVKSSPSLGERRESLRSIHSTHSSSASALTGCSESGGEGSAGYHEQDYAAVVDEYALLQRAVVDHDAEALHLLSAAEAAIDPGQRLLMAAGQCRREQQN